MTSVFKLTVLTIVCILGNTYLLQAQSKFSKYELGLSGGIFVYQGDLTPARFGSYRTMQRQVSLRLYRILTPSFSARLNITRGRLKGDEGLYLNPEFRKQRNFNFTTPVTEIAIQGVWNILGFKNPRFSPYFFAGGGISFLNIKRDYSKLNTEIFGPGSDVQNGLAIDIAKKLPRVMPVVPVGVGLRYTLNNRFSLTAETGYRLSFTDYLDGFSKAANPKLNDHYLDHSVGVMYSFNDNSSSKKNKKLGCPVW
jgi:Domain of unknown function (DUF6089)